MDAACSGAAAMEAAKRTLTELELESLGQVAEDKLGGKSRWACHLCKEETALVVISTSPYREFGQLTPALAFLSANDMLMRCSH